MSQAPTLQTRYWNAIASRAAKAELVDIGRRENAVSSCWLWWGRVASLANAPGCSADARLYLGKINSFVLIKACAKLVHRFASFDLPKYSFAVVISSAFGFLAKAVMYSHSIRS